MPVIDDIRAERAAVMKDGTFKQKISYFWDYNKGKIILVIALIAFLCTIIYKMCCDPEIILNGVMLNVFEKTGENVSDSVINDFSKHINLESGKEICINTSMFFSPSKSETDYENYQTMQKLLTESSTNDIDFITADITSMEKIAYYDFFIDLREILTQEQIEKYQSKFLYIDYSVLQKMKAADRNFEDSSLIPIPDSSNSEQMTEPIPVLINVSDSKKLDEYYNYSADALAIGIMSEKHKDILCKFLEFVIE